MGGLGRDIKERLSIVVIAGVIMGVLGAFGAGYLFVLGAILVVADNMAAALSGNPLVGSITAVVTAISDPFIGMIAGMLARMVIG